MLILEGRAQRSAGVKSCILAGVKATAMVLLKAGADAQAADKLGRTALDIAQEGAHIKLADFLRQWLPASAPDSVSVPPCERKCGSPAAAASTGCCPALLVLHDIFKTVALCM